jgi:hypothetical protein
MSYGNVTLTWQKNSVWLEPIKTTEITDSRPPQRGPRKGYAFRGPLVSVTPAAHAVPPHTDA